MAANEEQDFASMLEQFEREQGQPDAARPTKGQKVTGTVISVSGDAVFLDLGVATEGWVPRMEMVDEDGVLTVVPGDEVEAVVVGQDPEGGGLKLQVKAGRGGGGSEELKRAAEAGVPVEGLVTGTVKGGVEVQVAGQRAFCPISQLDLRYVEDAEEYVGRRLEFQVSRYEEGRGGRPNVVLSRRALLEEAAEERAAELRRVLEAGAVVEGTVTNVVDFGAFVDLGGLEGLLHVSEMSHQRVDDPSEQVTEGQRLEVKILEMGKDDKGRDRISLSTKALQRDPWSDAESRFSVGSQHRGRVVRLKEFGAFIELAPGIDGLAHVSELAKDRRIEHPREVMEVGETVEVKVLSVDPDRRRVSLTLAADAEEVEASDRYEVEPSGSSSFGAMGDFFAKAKKESLEEVAEDEDGGGDGGDDGDEDEA